MEEVRGQGAGIQVGGELMTPSYGDLSRIVKTGEARAKQNG